MDNRAGRISHMGHRERMDSNRMGNTERKSAVAELLELGKSKGKVTTQEINDAIEELDFDMEQMDKLYEQLEVNNIEVVEDFIPDLDLDFTLPKIGRASCRERV